mgnify:CR=1 FL=1
MSQVRPPGLSLQSFGSFPVGGPSHEQKGTWKGSAQRQELILRQTFGGMLGAQSQVVSARSEELTRAVFGEPLTPQQVVERVCHRVKTEGVAALLEFTRLFDRAELRLGGRRGQKTVRITRVQSNSGRRGRA